MKNAKKQKKLKDTRSERDRFAVVLEGLQTDFHVFGEKLDLVEEKFGREFSDIKTRLDRIESEIMDIKLEMADLKKLFTEKADLERLEKLERRVVILEKTLTARR